MNLELRKSGSDLNAHVRWCLIFQIIAGLFIFVCMMETCYYPYAVRSGIVLPWWHVRLLARLGIYLGLPAFLLGEMLHIKIPGMEWMFSAAWAAFVAWFPVRVFTMLRRNARHKIGNV